MAQESQAGRRLSKRSFCTHPPILSGLHHEYRAASASYVSKVARTVLGAGTVALLATFCLVVVMLSSIACERLAPTVTCDKIKALRLGMSQAQVRELLGAPITIGEDRPSRVNLYYDGGQWQFPGSLRMEVH